MKSFFAQQLTEATRLARCASFSWKAARLLGITALMTFAAHAALGSEDELSACVQSDKPSEPHRWVVKTTQPPAPYRWKGYNDELVDACLGPAHYRFPANYFYDQMGPDFQGNFGLMVQWPELQPLPPGKRLQRDMDTVYKEVRISPAYVGRVPITTLLERSIEAAPQDSHYQDHDPSRRMDLMDKQPQRYGLTPYYVDRDRFLAFLERRSRINGYKFYPPMATPSDWYIAHDSKDRLSTVVKCDSHLISDGLTIEDDRLIVGSAPIPKCTHDFVIPEDRLRVSIAYQRVLLKDWKRFEDRARELLTRYRVR